MLIVISYIDQKWNWQTYVLFKINIIKHLNMLSLIQVLKHINAWQCLYIFAGVIDSNQNQSEAHKKSGFIMIKSS